ncbi:MAG: DUF1877 family protein [Ramlibacter sp.]|nr:DUF1877 family protein [Cryobacterium sp.]
MGIRYYAYPITADEYPLALKNPCLFHRSDPLTDAWGALETRPEMLYLDKCWSDLQHLLGSAPDQPDRPALQLVGGRVTFTSTGWIPYERALGPAQVKAIAADLGTVVEADIRRMVSEFPPLYGSAEQTYEYVAQYLADAKHFTARLATGGWGLVYLIG